MTERTGLSASRMMSPLHGHPAASSSKTMPKSWRLRTSTEKVRVRSAEGCIHGFTRRVFVLCVHSVGMRWLQGSRIPFSILMQSQSTSSGVRLPCCQNLIAMPSTGLCKTSTQTSSRLRKGVIGSRVACPSPASVTTFEKTIAGSIKYYVPACEHAFK